jgi:hypothetical protein
MSLKMGISLSKWSLAILKWAYTSFKWAYSLHKWAYLSKKWAYLSLKWSYHRQSGHTQDKMGISPVAKNEKTDQKSKKDRKFEVLC